MDDIDDKNPEKFYDRDGNERTIQWMIENEKQWAANIIVHLRKKGLRLEYALQSAREERDSQQRVCIKVMEERDTLKAEAGRMREVIGGIKQYVSDTLSGRTDGPNNVEWHKEGEREILRRCKNALTSHAAPEKEETYNRPKIVTLCGSTRFKDAFDEANYQETMKGNVVLSVGFFMHATGNKHGDDVGATPEQKVELDVLHKKKIDISDEVLVLNVGGYIGESTRSEINHAIKKGVPVRYLEPIAEGGEG